MIPRNFNLLFAEKIVDWNSTTFAIYAVSFLVLSSLILKRPDNSYEWIVFLSSAFYQAAMLPVILVSNKIQAERANRTHSKEIQQELKLMREELRLLRKLCGEAE